MRCVTANFIEQNILSCFRIIQDFFVSKSTPPHPHAPQKPKGPPKGVWISFQQKHSALSLKLVLLLSHLQSTSDLVFEFESYIILY